MAAAMSVAVTVAVVVVVAVAATVAVEVFAINRKGEIIASTVTEVAV